MSAVRGPRSLWDNELEWGFDGRCSGECCRLITLNVAPERIAAVAAQEVLRRKKGFEVSYDPGFVVENFIFVRYSSYDGVTGQRRPGAPAAQYRCKLWDGKRCTNYAARPNLCRAYGFERSQLCRRPDCSLRPYAAWYAYDRWADDGGS